MLLGAIVFYLPKYLSKYCHLWDKQAAALIFEKLILTWKVTREKIQILSFQQITRLIVSTLVRLNKTQSRFKYLCYDRQYVFIFGTRFDNFLWQRGSQYLNAERKSPFWFAWTQLNVRPAAYLPLLANKQRQPGLVFVSRCDKAEQAYCPLFLFLSVS